nr:MAG TPA: hypothetical protein [Caudoviricetes sp.]
MWQSEKRILYIDLLYLTNYGLSKRAKESKQNPNR